MIGHCSIEASGKAHTLTTIATVQVNINTIDRIILGCKELRTSCTLVCPSFEPCATLLCRTVDVTNVSCVVSDIALGRREIDYKDQLYITYMIPCKRLYNLTSEVKFVRRHGMKSVRSQVGINTFCNYGCQVDATSFYIHTLKLEVFKLILKASQLNFPAK